MVSGFGIYHLGKQFGRKRRYKVGIKRLSNLLKTIDFSTFAIYICRLPWQINKTFIIRRFLSLRIVHAEHIEYTISDCEDIGFDIID